MTDQSEIAKIGDLITLERDGSFLAVDLLGNIIWEKVDGDIKSPSEFNRCIWKLCQRLSYTEQEMAHTMQRRKSLNEEELQAVLDEAIAENVRNQSDINENLGSIVNYGRVIQLQSVFVNKYITAKSDVSLNNRDYLRIDLEDGSSAAYFKIQPKYKIRSEGGNITYGDDILLNSIQQHGYYLNENKIGKGSNQKSKSGYHFNDASLSKTTVDTSITISLFARYHSEDNLFLRVGKTFRLFDREVEGFVEAFCTIDEKKSKDDLLGSLNPMEMKVPDMKVPEMKIPDMKIPGGIPNVPGMPMIQQKKELTPFVSEKVQDPHHPDSFSPKMVFMIEQVDRKKGGLIEWNKQSYRIRHVPTGKYLTVGDVNLKKKQGAMAMFDVANQMNAMAQAAAKAAADSAAAAAKGGKGLANAFDLSIPKEEELYNLTLEYETSKPEHSSRQVFQIKSVDKAQTFVPKQDVMIVITHAMESGTELVFHVNENRTVCMSSTQRSYDALLLIDVPDQNEQIVIFLSRAVPVLKAYISEVEGPSDGIPKSSADCQLESKIIENIILGSILGGQSSDPFQVEGPPLPLFQNCARDQKILDLLMSVVAAPTNAEIELKLSDSKGEGEEWIDKRFTSLVRVHKLAWRAVCFLTKKNTESEMYFLGIKVITKPKKEPVNYLSYFGLSYFENMSDLSKLSELSIPKMPDISQINLPGTIDVNDMGSMGSFQDMGNMKLEMPSMSIPGVDPFSLIGNDDPFASGPPKEEEMEAPPETVISPSLTIIINQISNPVGAAEVLTTLIDNNPQLQSKVVDNVMIDYFKRLIRDEGPSSRFIQFFQATCTCQGVPITRNQELCLTEILKKKEDFDRLAIKLVPYGQINVLELDVLPFEYPEPFLGDVVYRSGTFPQIVASWSGEDNWSMGCSSLYYTPHSIGMETLEGGVSLEELCWPLEPIKMCPIVKNESWSNYERNLHSDHHLFSQYQKHLKIAEFFLAQIELYSVMLYGRSYNLIYYFEQMFPYEYLLSAVLNQKLPSAVRAAFLTFLRRLWIERFPHEENCGRMSIPTRMWIFTLVEMHSIYDYGALPTFKLHSKSNLLKSPNPLESLNTPHKFLLLNKFVSSYLAHINRQVAENKTENIMIREVISLTNILCNYGFFPSIDDILQVVQPLLRILDGRADVDKATSSDIRELIYSGRTLEENEGIMPDYRIDDVQRYLLNESNMYIIESKRAALKLMQTLSNFRLQFALQRYLYLFRLHLKSNKFITPEDLTEIVQDSSALDFSRISDIPYDATLIDLLMYQEESLFEEAFTLLCMEHSTIHLILDNASQVMLIEHEKIPEFGAFEDIEGIGSELKRLLSTAEVWGQVTSFNETIDVEKYKSSYSIMSSLVSFLKITPVNQRQELLMQLNIHKTLFQVLSWDFGKASSNGTSPGGEKNNTFALAKKALEILRMIVTRNYKVQKAFVSFHELITNQTNTFPYESYSLLVEIFKLHDDIVSRTPTQLFNSFGQIIGDDSISILSRQFFYGQLALDRTQLDKDIPNPRNQNLVIQSIINAINHNKYNMELSSINSESTFLSHIEVMEILGLCCRQNNEIRTRTIATVLKWEIVVERLEMVLNSRAKSSDHGLGIPHLSNEENISQIRRSRFLASSINFLNWVNLSKGFDATIVKEPSLLKASRQICLSIINDKSFTGLLLSKNMLVRTAVEDELYAKLSFLLALVLTNVCTDSELLQNIVTAASSIVDDKESPYSVRVTATSRKILEILMPGKVMVGAFRPGEVDQNEIIYKESIKGKSEELIEYNKDILEKCQDLLYNEKLSILYALMNASVLTDPNDSSYIDKISTPSSSFQEVRTNKITWKNLAGRFIAYIDRCIVMGRDLNISMKIMELFCFYLSEGEKIGADVLIERQNELNSFGVTCLIHRILQRLSSGIFVVVSLKLGTLLMHNGNRTCQESFVEYAKTNDSDGKFFGSTRDALNNLNDWIAKTLFDPDADRIHEDIVAGEATKELIEGLQFLKFLSSLCATNNLNAQVMLHDQSSFNRQSIDLIESVNQIIETIIPNRNAYRNTSMQHMEILIASLDFLIVALLGPCPQNQAILERNKTFYALKIILSSTTKNIDISVATHVKCLVVKLCYSCLEGRFGTNMEDSIITKIELKVFEKLFMDLCLLLDQFNSSKVAELYVGNITVADNNDNNHIELNSKNENYIKRYNFECKPIKKEVLELTLRDLTSVRWRLAFRQNVNLDESISTIQQSHKNIMENIVRIEIYWIDHTEVAYFPLPYECQYLSETSKMDFLNKCDLSSPDSRVKSLMDTTELFFDEMIVYRSLIQKFPLYSSIMRNYYNLKLSLFGLSLLLNIAVMLSFTQHGPTNFYFTDYSYSTSKIVLVLGICLLAGYTAILVYWILPAIPLRFRELSRLSMIEVDPSKKRDWTAFNLLFGGIGFSIVLFVIHFYSLSDRNDSWALVWTYICTGITIFVPWFIFCYRTFVTIPTTSLDFIISISIDLLSNSSILTTTVFIGAIIGGLLNRVFLFSLLLLDFMLLSEQAMNVVRSVVRPWRSLLSIFLVYCICICIFGFFGILLFNYSEFISTDDLACTSLTQCMGLVFYGGLRTQDISNIMNSSGPDANHPTFPDRLFFDLLFFIVLGVLLFNMVTGIIVDTFASLREETESRVAILRDETFVSGLLSDDLEKAKTSFIQIQNEQQNIWNYVYYIYYLKHKNPYEYDGIESFVASCIVNGDNSWFPKRTCAASERNSHHELSKEDETNNRLAALEEQIKKMEELLVKQKS